LTAVNVGNAERKLILKFVTHVECADTDSRTAVPLVKNADVHVISGLLKVYLRELPEALFTDTLYPKLVEGYGE